MTTISNTPRVSLRPAFYQEGQSAARQGYTGGNPYHGCLGNAQSLWRSGYLDTIAARLADGEAALPEKGANA